MKRLSLFAIYTLAFCSIISCAPNSNEDRPAKIANTAQPHKPVIVDEYGYRIARGATRFPEISVVFDKLTKTMTLKGRLEYLTLEGRSLESLQMDMTGLMDSEGFVQLRDRRDEQLRKSELRLVAKATCLSEAGDCSSSFIDIYLYSEGVVYHHQIESHQEGAETPLNSGGTSSSPEEKTEDKNIESGETQGGADEVDGEPGQYVGSIQKDIEQLLEIKPTPQPIPPVKPEDNKDEKKDDKKEEAPKTPPRDTPKVTPKETPKETPKGTPKVDAPKGGNPKKDEPKHGAPPKDTPKAEPPKREEPKIVSQAIGSVNAGRLQNATNVLKLQATHAPAGFTIMRPQRLTHFSAKEMAHLIMQMGLFTKSELPGQNLLVGDISRQAGGALGSHKSHQNGLDVDAAYYFSNKNLHGSFVSAVAGDRPHANWLIHEQWKLFKKVVSTKIIDRIFIHRVLKKSLCNLAISNGELTKDMTSGLAHETLRRLIADTTHDDHFHLRVKCSSDQVRCRQMAEPAAGSGCF